MVDSATATGLGKTALGTAAVAMAEVGKPQAVPQKRCAT
jgi:hypothetical protein